jgi:hypothetical protein
MALTYGAWDTTYIEMQTVTPHIQLNNMKIKHTVVAPAIVTLFSANLTAQL